jgi:charged multivesicular body protein 2A
MNFEQESEMLDMKDEMMSDALDEVTGEEDDEEESDQIVNQVLDEIGISLNNDVSIQKTKINLLNLFSFLLVIRSSK